MERSRFLQSPALLTTTPCTTHRQALRRCVDDIPASPALPVYIAGHGNLIMLYALALQDRREEIHFFNQEKVYHTGTIRSFRIGKIA